MFSLPEVFLHCFFGWKFKQCPRVLESQQHCANGKGAKNKEEKIGNRGEKEKWMLYVQCSN